MNFNLRRVLMVKCVFARGSYRYTILFTHTHTQLEQRQQQQQQCEQFPPFAVQKRNLKKKEERTSLYGAHLCQQENKPLIRSTLTSSTVVNNFSSPFKKSKSNFWLLLQHFEGAPCNRSCPEYEGFPSPCPQAPQPRNLRPRNLAQRRRGSGVLHLSWELLRSSSGLGGSASISQPLPPSLCTHKWK